MFAALSMAKKLLRSRRPWRRVGRAVVLWLSLISFSLVAGGAPIPEAPQIGQGGAYPCQGHRCGCGTAQQCWQSCCCFSNSQKLAWAKQHGIAPPAEVAATVVAKPTKTCCVKIASKPKACCLAKKSSQSQHDAQADDTWSLALQKAKCRGAATQWLTLGAVLPMPELHEADALASVASLPMQDEWMVSPVYRPAAPPPRG